MEVKIHGGDIYSYQEKTNKKIIDFSSNINPMGIPKGLREGLIENLESVKIYPDIEYRRLKRNLSRYLGAEDRFIEVGNGAVEIIDQVISLFDRLILTHPTFAEYSLRAQVHGLDIIDLDLNKDLSYPLDLIKKTIQEGDLLIITNPDNPSGRTLTELELLEIYTEIVKKDGFLLLDEAFFEFADLNYDSIDIFKRLDFSNVGIIRAATKFFSLPGIRLGYGVFPMEIKEKLDRISLPWRINAFADLSSDYIFDSDFIEKSRAYMRKERSRFLEDLGSIRGVHPYDSNSNYILLKLDNISEDFVFRSLLQEGLLIRQCSNFRNLEGTHIRLAIKTREENQLLGRYLKKIMEE